MDSFTQFGSVCSLVALKDSVGHDLQGGAFAFRDLDDAVSAGKCDFIATAARPENLELVDFSGGAKAEVDARVGRRGVARAAKNVAALADAASREKHLCAD